MSPAITAAVDALIQARQTRTQIDPKSLAALLESPDEAYAVQEQVAARLGWFSSGGPTMWKAGAGSRTSMSTGAPLPPQGVKASPARFAAGDFHLIGIEAEVAFRFARDVTADEAARPGASPQAWLDALCVSIEIVDTRWVNGLQAPALLKLADLQSHGALVLGEMMPLRPVDWARQRCVVAINGETRADVRGTHSCGDATWPIHWLAQHALQRHRPIRRGDVVTTGTWAGLIEAHAGDQVVVTFDDIGSAEVQL